MKKLKKSYWGYRVVRKESPDNPNYKWLEFREVYEEKGKFMDLSSCGLNLGGTGKKGLKKVIKQLRKAMEMPILIEKEAEIKEKK